MEVSAEQTESSKLSVLTFNYYLPPSIQMGLHLEKNNYIWQLLLCYFRNPINFNNYTLLAGQTDFLKRIV